MSDYEKHIGKLKKVDLSNYNNNTEKFFEEQYRKLFTNFSEKKIKDLYSWSKNYVYRKNRGIWEYLFFDTCLGFGIKDKFFVAKGNIYETIEDVEVGDSPFLNDNGDGTYDYFMEFFYNGGTCLRDCIEHELEKL